MQGNVYLRSWTLFPVLYFIFQIFPRRSLRSVHLARNISAWKWVNGNRETAWHLLFNIWNGPLEIIICFCFFHFYINKTKKNRTKRKRSFNKQVAFLLQKRTQLLAARHTILSLQTISHTLFLAKHRCSEPGTRAVWAEVFVSPPVANRLRWISTTI